MSDSDDTLAQGLFALGAREVRVSRELDGSLIEIEFLHPSAVRTAIASGASLRCPTNFF